MDAGCGNGYMSKEFAKLVKAKGKVYALDPDKTSIDTLTAQIEDGIIKPLVADITKKTEIPESSVDLMYLSTVFHGFTKTQITGFVKEAKRLLKPQGKLAILEIKKEQTPFGPPMEIRFSPDQLQRSIKLKNIDLVEVSQYFYMKIFEK